MWSLDCNDNVCGWPAGHTYRLCGSDSGSCASWLAVGAGELETLRLFNGGPFFWFAQRRNSQWPRHMKSVFRRIGFEAPVLEEPDEYNVLLARIAVEEGFALMPESFTRIRRVACFSEKCAICRRLKSRLGIIPLMRSCSPGTQCLLRPRISPAALWNKPPLQKIRNADFFKILWKMCMRKRTNLIRNRKRIR